MPDSFEFVGFLFTPGLSVCSLRFILTFLSGVSSELSAGDLKHDIEKAQRNDNDGDQLIIMMNYYIIVHILYYVIDLINGIREIIMKMVMVRGIRNLTVAREGVVKFS